MQRTIELTRPEVQKLPQFGKVRMQVVTLSDETLQNARMIGHPIENIGGGQTSDGRDAMDRARSILLSFRDIRGKKPCPAHRTRS
jgi:hypothetical protein